MDAFTAGTTAHRGEDGWLNLEGDLGWVGLRGYLLDAPIFGGLRGRPDSGIVFNPNTGQIVEVGDYLTLLRRRFPQPVRWLYSERRLVVCPGLIDVHAHLPQYPASARGEGELLPWLRQHIFPLERDFIAARARRECPRFFRELARHGTTTVMLYAAIYEESCDLAFRAAELSGMRVILGKMMMDVGSYGTIQPKQIPAVSQVESERLCRRWHGAAHGRLAYAFSPRFAVSCSEQLMRAAADTALRYEGAYLQTHLAENRAEVERVRHLFPDAKDYTHVYERCGLLTPRTVLGHCLHLSDREIATLARTGARVAHCPTANWYLQSGLLPLERLLDAGVPVGLGSDVGAGPELNLWQVMRSAVETQSARVYYEPHQARPLKPAEAFYLATQGGARVLHLGDRIGTLEAGKEADLVALDLDSLLPYSFATENARLADGIPPAELINLCVYRGGPHATVAAFVRGRPVHRTILDAAGPTGHPGFINHAEGGSNHNHNHHNHHDPHPGQSEPPFPSSPTTATLRL